jgi:outer membrane protein TolC
VNSNRAARMETQVRKRIPGGICVLSMLLVAGCTVGPNYKRPAAEVPAVYKEVGNWKQAQPNEQNLGGNWWEMFQDPQLNALELQVNISNQNLKAAEAQYTQARALLRYNWAAYFPTITGGASATRNRISNHRPASVVANGIT